MISALIRSYFKYLALGIGVLSFAPSGMGSGAGTPATEAEIEAMDPSLRLAMFVDNLKVDGKDAPDSIYEKIYDDENYGRCVDRSRGAAVKFVGGVFTASFSYDRKATANGEVKLQLMPPQVDAPLEKCLKDQIYERVIRSFDQPKSVSGKLKFKYSKPITRDK